MERTTISLPEERLDRLRRIAAEEGTSMAASRRPTPRSLGIGASGCSDIVRRSGEERPKPRPWR